MNLYEVQGVSHRYRLDGQHVQALCGVDLNVGKGEFLAILAHPAPARRGTRHYCSGFPCATSSGTGFAPSMRWQPSAWGR